MNTHHWPVRGIISLCTLFAPVASAHESADMQETYFPSASSIENKGFSASLRGRSDFSNVGREWVAELEHSGIVNRSLRGPYRVALPLVSFGHRGPTLMITYARKLPGAAGGRGVLLFVNIPIE
jgi:hypothetical protein